MFVYKIFWLNRTKRSKDVKTLIPTTLLTLTLTLNGLIIWRIQLATKRATKRPHHMAYSVGNKMALLYGLFNWQQNGLKWPYYMTYSIDNRTVLLHRVRVSSVVGISVLTSFDPLVRFNQNILYTNIAIYKKQYS